MSVFLIRAMLVIAVLLLSTPAVAANPSSPVCKGQYAFHAAYINAFSACVPLIEFKTNGSNKRLIDTNKRLDREKMDRYSEKTLVDAKLRGAIVRLRASAVLRLDPTTRDYIQYAHPRTRTFMEHLAIDFKAEFPDSVPIQVNSAVRTREYQRGLRSRNSNATSVHGPKASSHLTGATVDIGKFDPTKANRKDLTLLQKLRPGEQLQWLRGYLTAAEHAGITLTIEEESQAVFHVTVFCNCTPGKDTGLVAAGAQ